MLGINDFWRPSYNVGERQYLSSHDAKWEGFSPAMPVSTEGNETTRRCRLAKNLTP